MLQVGDPVQSAEKAAAQEANRAQHPLTAQSHVPGSSNTGWQSERAAQSASLSMLEHSAPPLAPLPPASPELAVVEAPPEPEVVDVPPEPVVAEALVAPEPPVVPPEPE